MSEILIPFNKPELIGNEIEYIQAAITSGHLSGDGQFTKKCNRYLEEKLNVPKVLLTTSCTHALEMSAFILDIQPGDEFIVPSFTFVTTANSYVIRGAKPVFIDIRSDTLNMDEAQLETLITPRTRAILPVHYAGVGCEMYVISEIARKYNIPIVEDNAHGLFGKYKGQNLGTFGDLATQSFHETKNISCGEGGAILINNPDHFTRAEIIREKGTNRSQFFRGQVDKYTWVDIGSSYLPSEILAAFLFGQLEKSSLIQEKRKKIWNRYHLDLQDWAEENSVQLPFVPQHCEQTYHMYYMLLPDLDVRQRLIAYLREHGIQSVFHYLPLHLSVMGRKFGGEIGDCPVTEDITDRLLRLPFYNSLTDEEQEEVIEAILNFSM